MERNCRCKGAGLGDVEPDHRQRPEPAERLYGNEHTIRAILAVTHVYRAKHPHAPRVVIGDISREGGGPMDDHASHQNGLDVDVYFPRRRPQPARADVTPARSTTGSRRISSIGSSPPVRR